MIGKYIAYLLGNYASLTSLVPAANIYPIATNPDTQLPSIVYTIDSLTPDYDKDGWVQDECEFSVMSFANSYASLQLIVVQVRNALEMKYGLYDGVEIQRIYLQGMEETADFDMTVFGNKLTFKVNIIKK